MSAKKSKEHTSAAGSESPRTRSKKPDPTARPPGQLSIAQMFGGKAAADNSNSSAAATSTRSRSPARERTPNASTSTDGRDWSKSKILNLTDKSEFEMRLSASDRAYLQYEYVTPYQINKKDEIVLDLTHTVVPKNYQRQGIAGILVEHAFEFAKRQGVAVRPSCTYVQDFVAKNPKYQPMLEQKKETHTSTRTTTAAAAASSREGGGGGGGKTFQKQPVPTQPKQSNLHPSSATAASSTSANGGARRHDRPDGEEHVGSKRHSPVATSDLESSEKNYDWKKKAKPDESASVTVAPPPSKPPSPIPIHHVPLPFNAMFLKKWTNTLAAVSQAREISASFISAMSTADPASSASLIATAVDDVTDLMRQISLKKELLDTRCLGLQYFLNVYISDELRLTYLQHTIPFILQLIHDLPTIFDPTRPENVNLKPFAVGCLPILRCGQEQSLNLTKHQIVALLACSFFGLQAEHLSRRAGDPARFKSSNFDGLWLNIGRQIKHHLGTNDTPEEIRSENQTEVEKMKCLLQYFECMRVRVTGAANKKNPNAKLYSHILSGLVTFHRKVLKLNAADIEARLLGTAANMPISTQTDLRSVGTIEDDGYGTMQIDFANKFLGGGVLTGGCIQEEIRLTINPECLIGLLFVEVMDVNESVTMIGPERFTNYKGYSKSFEYDGPHIDLTPIDPILNRMKTVIVAIDAIAFRRKMAQYEKPNILREILKAYSGFALEDSVMGLRSPASEAGKKEEAMMRAGKAITSYAGTTSSSSATSAASASASSTSKKGITDVEYSFQTISTGNWGCGAFGGEVPLKTLIQLIACTLAKRHLRYFTFAADVCEPLPDLLAMLNELKPCIKELYLACIRYHPYRTRGRTPSQYIRDLLDGTDQRKQQEWRIEEEKAAEAERAATGAASSSKQATLPYGRPPLSRPTGAANSTSTPAAAASSTSARHANFASSTVADADSFDMDSDPIMDFADDEDLADGYDSEAEKALREAEGLMEE